MGRPVDFGSAGFDRLHGRPWPCFHGGGIPQQRMAGLPAAGHADPVRNYRHALGCCPVSPLTSSGENKPAPVSPTDGICSVRGRVKIYPVLFHLSSKFTGKRKTAGARSDGFCYERGKRLLPGRQLQRPARDRAKMPFSIFQTVYLYCKYTIRRLIHHRKHGGWQPQPCWLPPRQ